MSRIGPAATRNGRPALRTTGRTLHGKLIQSSVQSSSTHAASPEQVVDGSDQTVSLTASIHESLSWVPA
ncbi:hypothetical protein OV320_6371 [Actinobacteria bacterium OV320]|nr:hypothetical protein OV320_6371 [Actinobacteria bacterium OV320]